MAISIVVGLAVTLWESRRGHALGSDILLAAAAHTRSDVLTTAAVLGGLIAMRPAIPRPTPGSRSWSR